MANYYEASNITGLAELFQYSNYVSGFWLGRLFIIAFFVTTLIVMGQKYDSKSAFVTASLLAAIFSIFFRVLGILNNFDVFFSIVMALIALSISMKSQY